MAFEQFVLCPAARGPSGCATRAVRAQNILSAVIFNSTCKIEIKSHGPTTTSAWRSSLKTGKKPRPDWTRTDQDLKILRLVKTGTAVRSSVFHNFKIYKTGKRPVFAVSTGLLQHLHFTFYLCSTLMDNKILKTKRSLFE